MKHDSHPDVIKRLKRAQGHLKKTITMMEEDRACTDLAQQLHAVEKAIGNAKRVLISDHIDHCLQESLENPGKQAKARIAEFKEIAKYL